MLCVGRSNPDGLSAGAFSKRLPFQKAHYRDRIFHGERNQEGPMRKTKAKKSDETKPSRQLQIGSRQTDV